MLGMYLYMCTMYRYFVCHVYVNYIYLTIHLFVYPSICPSTCPCFHVYFVCIVCMYTVYVSRYYTVYVCCDCMQCMHAMYIYYVFFSMEMNIYTINIKTMVTWHHDYYECQGYKRK